MKRVLKVIQMVLTCIVLMGLYAFTNYRNERRMVTEIDLKFIGNDNLYTTYEAVNKMLIVKQKGAFKAPKDKVALSIIEQWLIEDPMLQNATVYMTVDGALRALLTQRTPEARVVTDSV
ncbi:MAG: cell division protein FtsQ, partial [Flavobacteriaceae bacterium]